MSEDVSLRPANSEDDAFLLRVFVAARAADFAHLPGGLVQQEALLQWQFDAQRLHYRQQFPEANDQIVLSGSQPLGRLYVARREHEIRVLDIALMPQHRNSGIGGALLKQLLAEAVRDGKPVRLQVERSNPAQRLYQRLGFRATADSGVYLQMEWSAHGSGGAAGGTAT